MDHDGGSVGQPIAGIHIARRASFNFDVQWPMPMAKYKCIDMKLCVIVEPVLGKCIQMLSSQIVDGCIRMLPTFEDHARAKEMPQSGWTHRKAD